MIRANSGLLLSTLGYIGGLGAVIVGGAFAASALLSTVPKPAFLAPEHEWKSAASLPSSPEPAPEVFFRPRRPPAPIQPYWRGSLISAHSTNSALKSAEAGKPEQTKAKASKQTKRKARKQQRHRAMDAYALQPR